MINLIKPVIHTHIYQKILLPVALLILVFFALALRIHHLDYQSLFMDEIRQVSYYKYSFWKIINYAASQQQPPLDYWVGHIFYFYSNSDFSVRLPSAIFGTGSVLLITLLTAQICRLPIAIGIGFIYSLLPFSIYFSQEARPYSICIFFFLATLFQLNYLTTLKIIKLKHYVILTTIIYFFLLTRTLVPIVIITSLTLILISFLIYKLWRKGNDKLTFKKQALTLTSFAVALLLYLPFFKNILTARESSSYISGTNGLDIKLLIHGIENFSFSPMWPAFVVQTEPLTFFILIATIVGISLTLFIKEIRSNFLMSTAAILLPTACILHLFIFQAFTTESFRPPYAIYLSPLCLVLSAQTIDRLWDTGKKNLPFLYLRIITIAACLILFFILISSLVDFKNREIKSDWKGTISYISEKFGPQHVYITDTLTNTSNWEPGLYGINRYHYLKTPYAFADLKMIKAILNLPVAVRNWKPVLIIFQYRNYFLTSKSKYGLFPLDSPDPIPLSSFKFDPVIHLEEFTGLSVFNLKSNNGNLFGNMQLLLEKVIQGINPDPSAIDLVLALAYLEKSCGINSFQQHMELAERLSNNSNVIKINKIKKMIFELSDDEIIDCFDSPDQD